MLQNLVLLFMLVSIFVSLCGFLGIIAGPKWSKLPSRLAAFGVMVFGLIVFALSAVLSTAL